LLPVRVLSRLFRGKFVAGLRAAYEAGRLGCHGRLAALAERAAFAEWLAGLAGREWVVYSKPPFAGPEVVLKYLARYTHRICVSNRRLVALAEGQVTLRYKDYAADQRQKTLTVSAAEFIRRFLQHVLPGGFVRVRHYGLLANRYREAKLAVCRRLLLVHLVVAVVVGGPQREATPCPGCGGTTWRVLGRVPRPTVAEVCRLPLGEDTS
jgi:Putative transposase